MEPSSVTHVHSSPDKQCSNLSLEILGCNMHLDHADINVYERLITSFATEDYGQQLEEEKQVTALIFVLTSVFLITVGFLCFVLF